MAGILVTGGCGYVGSRLVRRLATSAPGADVRILDNLQRDSHRALMDLPAGPRYSFVQGDILDRALLRRALGGVETVIGVVCDPVFGPAVMFGLGGVFVEVLKDVTFRLAPFGVDEAHRMIDEIAGRAMLDGVRGAPPADIAALAEALSKLSVFAAENADRIETIDVNPFIVLPEGAVAVDALIVPKGKK